MNIFPAIVFVFSFFVIVRIWIIKVKYREGKNSVALFLSGFIGFFLSLPISFELGLEMNYFLVPFAFLTIALFGFIGCLAFKVNPFYPNSGVGIVTVQREETDQQEKGEKKGSFYTPQTELESSRIVQSIVGSLGTPFYYLRNLNLKYMGDKLDFKIILLSPKAIYHIYPCNWTGKTEFTNSGAKRKEKEEMDAEDTTISSIYRKDMLKRMAIASGLSHLPVETVICMTNPTAEYETRQSTYRVIASEELTSFLREGQSLVDANKIEEFKNTLKKAAK